MNSRPCDALLLDLDGTLVDSQRDIAEALNAALAAGGFSVLSLEAITPMIGDGARALVARALHASGRAEPAAPLVERTLASFQRAYADLGLA